VINGDTTDTLAVMDGTWSQAGTLLFDGSFNGLSDTYNVWNQGCRQLLVHETLLVKGLS
jgi:hypothetical protein